MMYPQPRCWTWDDFDESQRSISRTLCILRDVHIVCILVKVHTSLLLLDFEGRHIHNLNLLELG
jgi:hypothetical protein